MAPPTKPPGTRRRRSQTQAAWKTFGAAPRSAKAPPLPARRPAWTASTRSWWKRVWRAPMASAYLEADLGALYRLAELVEQQARRELAPGGHAAITALEDRFGMSPKARQLLQWQVLAAGDAPASVAPASSPPGGQAASVRRLRAVDPSTASA